MARGTLSCVGTSDPARAEPTAACCGRRACSGGRGSRPGRRRGRGCRDRRPASGRRPPRMRSLSGPRSQLASGIPNPFLGRSMISSGILPRAASLSRYLPDAARGACSATAARTPGRPARRRAAAGAPPGRAPSTRGRPWSAPSPACRSRSRAPGCAAASRRSRAAAPSSVAGRRPFARRNRARQVGQVDAGHPAQVARHHVVVPALREAAQLPLQALVAIVDGQPADERADDVLADPAGHARVERGA